MFLIGTGAPLTSVPTFWRVREEMQPDGAIHLFRTKFATLEVANKRAAQRFISEVTSGWTPEDRAGPRKAEFAKEVLDILPALGEGETFWQNERDCKIDGKEGTFVVWVEKAKLGDDEDS